MTGNSSACGIYGKLPAHGDFISRNLPSAFLNYWDEWLQGFIASSQEQLNDDWLNTYLTGPIWRFALSRGCADGNAWIGVMMPSVDSVGRYFPFCVVNKLQNDSNLVDIISSQAGWYAAMEDLALEALQNEYDADTIMEKLQDHPFNDHPYYYRRNPSLQPSEVNAGQTVNLALVMDFEEQLPSSTNAVLLDWLMARQFPSYSLWHSRGSDLVQPSFLVSQGLPNLGGAAAMLQGDWKKWNWNMPFQLAADAVESEELVF
ncbi:MAG: type VI secretion system-associated protein TagF [Gammaproteobacteria bacterium]|nr:type VI secretion system-associated protein TagF [Gammaproteobacteria bacterium]